ncbi:MAG: AmmeMemoRadiSam system protein A [Cellulomonas sp.]
MARAGSASSSRAPARAAGTSPGPDRPIAGTSRDPDAVPDDAGDVLLPAARTAIAKALGAATGPADADADADADDRTPPAWALEPGACFVTLTKNGRLRGCIGSPTARRPLLDDVRANAAAAATRDPRFAPMTPGELTAVVIEVSVLSAPQPLRVSSLRECYAALRPGVDGVILDVGLWHRSLLLPQVWQDVPDPAQFLAHLWLKAGLAPGIWHEGTTLQTFTVRAWIEGPEAAGER